MYSTKRMEQFSLVYIRAVAALAGYQVNIPEVDDNSIDGWFIGCEGRRPRIEFQAKATAKGPLPDDATDFHFDLKIKNYNDLRADTIVQRLLIIVLVPENDKDWASQNEAELVLRRCGYWVSLCGQSDSSNKASIRIQVPRSNILSSETLQYLMNKAERGELI